MKKLLVTGANGLLAGRFLNDFSKKFNIVSTCHDDVLNPVKSVQYLKIDFTKEFNPNDFPSDVDVIIHLSQSSEYRNFPSSAPNIFDVNTNSTAKLLDYANDIKVEKFIYFSTGGVYEPGSNIVNECSNLLSFDKFNYHFTSKFSAELLISNYRDIFDCIIVRPFFIYGENQRNSMLIPGLIQKIKNKQIITLDGDQGIKVNPIYVADASRCLPCLISEPVRGVFNLSGPEVLSLKQICDTIGKEIKVDPLYQYSGKPALDLVASTKKMKTIGFSPNIHFKETLKLIL